jgi:hypothetical protein
MNKIKLTNPAHVRYSGGDDAVRALKLAIGNGQARLALEIIPDIVDGLIEALEYVLENSNIDSESIDESKNVNKPVSNSQTQSKTSQKKNNSSTQIEEGINKDQ